MLRKAVIPLIFVIVGVLTAFWIFLLSVEAKEAQAIVGQIAVPTAIVISIWKLIQILFPEAAKLFVAWLLRKIGKLPLNLKRRVVSNEVEGNLTRALKEFGCEGSGFAPYLPKVEWTSDIGISPDSFFRDGKIIVRLDYSDNPHRNIVESALLYCKAGLLPETRHYLWMAVVRALDLVFVHVVLERNNLREGALYFKQEVVEPELNSNADVEANYNDLFSLHERGYFTRIVLPELRDYAGRVHRADTRTQHQQWITNFLSFLGEAAREHPPGIKRALDHIKRRFKVSIIIVGERWKVASQGQRPYLKRIAMCADLGARTVFIIGPSDSIPEIAKNAVKLKIVDESECDSYHVAWHHRIQRNWCGRLDISEQTAASAMTRAQAFEDWPDFETTVDTEEVNLS